MVHIVKEGPWGGPDGKDFDTETVSKFLGFRVWSDEYINGIQFAYLKDSHKVWTEVYGSEIGHPVEITFQAEEFFTGIQGTLDWKENFYVVRSLTFLTNSMPYGPYGNSEKGSINFSLKSACKIVGFFGRAEQQINAIGIYIEV